MKLKKLLALLKLLGAEYPDGEVPVVLKDDEDRDFNYTFTNSFEACPGVIKLVVVPTDAVDVDLADLTRASTGYGTWLAKVLNLIGGPPNRGGKLLDRGDEPHDSWASGQSAEDYANFVLLVRSGYLPRES